MSGIVLPSGVDARKFVLTTSEDERLGFAVVEGSELHLWSKEAGSRNGWTQSRVFNLRTLLPVDVHLTTSPRVVGFADGVGVIILWAADGFFTFNPKSGEVMKIEDNREKGTTTVCNVVPYRSFYAPQWGYNFA
ncbi:hypothetical protein PR202_gb12083 [Eleusine coracana subsp. coracana]|uniref:Uncharacterized protein n=1 Tax=Eleusine coracana subsp. coracana TaxID=191504 RepID=A0AAV5EQH5_ELECO|nr:hypothetical protein PR202_gb12083 [Eleusine coracana subsp. coracana]